MCGIVGTYTKNGVSKELLQKAKSSLSSIVHRGPDFSALWNNEKTVLGHARLSIIDTSEASNQPFIDASGKYVLVFNGEIFNYKELKHSLTADGISFNTEGDAEVFLELYKLKKEKAFEEMKGFFSAAIYNTVTHELCLVRDRFGVKPLYFQLGQEHVVFGSEISAIRQMIDSQKLNYAALSVYFQLNYIGGSNSIFSEINKIPPGHFALATDDNFTLKPYYSLRSSIANVKTSPDQNTLYELLENSVNDRLIADVPVGSFISGGIDSTIITGLASKIKPDLATFCLGFKDNAWYDESKYAEIAAKHFKTSHQTFLVDEEEMLSELDSFLDSIDEPFADSSALNVYVLCKKTSKHVKVVLSGDGADEIFGGYNKHRAVWLSNNSKMHQLVSTSIPLLKLFLPSSRNSLIGNSIRQMDKFNRICKLSFKEQYWELASITSEEEALARFKNKTLFSNGKKLKQELLDGLEESSGINSMLTKDVELVLEGDMLVKADRMSMRHGLEIRNPFLDHKLVEWALSVSDTEKINGKSGKIILKKTFNKLIPETLIHRKKHGFEIPLHRWMNTHLKNRIENNYLGKEFIMEQGLFDYDEIVKLKGKLFSKNPGDAPSKVWAIIIFNHWYQKNNLKLS